MATKPASQVEARDRGSALLLTLMLAVLLSGLGLGLITLSGTERAVAGNSQSGVETLYAAEAIAERVVLDLASDQRWSEALAGNWQSSFAGGTVTPWGQPIDLAAVTADLQRETDAASAWGPNTPRWRLFSFGSFSTLVGAGTPGAPAYLIAWLADDPSELDSDPITDTNGVVLVRARAVGPQGLSRSVHVVLERGGVGVASPVRLLSWREVR